MNIEINTAYLDADTKTMQTQLEALKAAQTQVLRSLLEVDSMWEGAANQAFVAQIQVDARMLQELLKSIKNLIECLEYAKEQYNNCTEDVNSKIAALRMSGDY